MGWRVVLTPQARADLREITIFIARGNRERARTFGRTLLDKALSLEEFPERGRIVPEEDDPAVREIIHGAYRIMYEVMHTTMTVSILRFWHGARGTPELSGD